MAPDTPTVTSELLPTFLRYRASQVAIEVKNPPANEGDMSCGFNPWVRKTPLEEGVGIHYSVLA